MVGVIGDMGLREASAHEMDVGEMRTKAQSTAVAKFSDQWENFKECIHTTSNMQLRHILDTFFNEKTSSEVVMSDADVDVLRKSLAAPADFVAFVKQLHHAGSHADSGLGFYETLSKKLRGYVIFKCSSASPQTLGERSSSSVAQGKMPSIPSASDPLPAIPSNMSQSVHMVPAASEPASFESGCASPPSYLHSISSSKGQPLSQETEREDFVVKLLDSEDLVEPADSDNRSEGFHPRGY